MVVINIKGEISSTISGFLGMDDKCNNEFQAFMESIKCAFVENREDFILESDHVDAFW